MTNDNANSVSSQPSTPQGTPMAPVPPAPAAQMTAAAAVAEAEANAKEEILWVGRTSWRHFIGSLSLWVLGSVLWGGLMGWALSGKPVNYFMWIVVLPIAAVGAIILIRILWIVLSTRYQITNQRIFFYRGLLSQTIDQTELVRVDDVRVYKSLTDRMLGLGSVEVVSTDASDRDTRLNGIREPDRVAETVRSNMKRLRKRAMFVEGL